MTEEQTLNAIRKIKKTHENLVVYGGIAMGFTLAVYFFTFPQLIDHGATGILWFQGITTILAGFGFVYLKKIAYAITKLLLGRDPLRRQLMASLTPTDLLKDDENLLEFVSQGKGA